MALTLLFEILPMLPKISNKLLTYIYWGFCAVLIVLIIGLEGRLLPRSASMITLLLVAGGLTWKVQTMLSHRYRELQFKPLKPKKLRRAMRRYFDHNTQVLEQYGYSALGDFQLLPDPGRLIARFLISPGGKGIAELWELNDLADQFFFSLISVASDGTFFESSSLPFKESPSASEHLQFQSVSGLSIIEALRQHQQWVREYESEHEVQIISIAADRFQEIINYGHRLAGHDGFQQGQKTTAPKELCEI